MRRGARRAVCTLHGAVRDDGDCAEALAHVRRALALALRIAELRERAVPCDLSEGVIIADGEGHVLAADAPARERLAGATEIPLGDLSRCASEPGVGARSLTRGADPNSRQAPAFVLSVADLRRAAALPIDGTGARYSLTAAEARLAAHLTGGETIAQLSEALGISLAAARNQLRSLFAKTGTHRQVELVALFAHIPGILRP